MGKIIAYCREGCGYSLNTKNILLELSDEIKRKNNKTLSVLINPIKNEVSDKNNILNSLGNLIGNHSTFPIIIYESTKGKQFFIGGNNDFMEIINYVDSIKEKINFNDLSTCMSDKLLLGDNLYDEGKRRLICNLLMLKNKINLS